MISRINTSHGQLTFRLKENVSVANALRRTIMADIKTAVLHPRSIRITKNTTRFTNEIVAQRLGCVPVYTQEPTMEGTVLTIDVKNTGEETVVVTTADIKLEGVQARELFPPAEYEGHECYVDIVRLRPAVANIAGEEIKLECAIEFGCAKESGMFNVASTCSYAATQNQAASDAAFTKEKGDKENWNLLEAKRFIDPDSFDFVLETLGVYTNHELVSLACDVIIKRLANLEYRIQPSLTTMANCVDVVLVDGDYTIGKLLEYEVFKEHTKRISYVTFLKVHPHDDEGVLRIALLSGEVPEIVSGATTRLSSVFTEIRKMFGRSFIREVHDDLEEFKKLGIDEKRDILTSKGVDAKLVEKASEEQLNSYATQFSKHVEQQKMKASDTKPPAKKKGNPDATSAAKKKETETEHEDSASAAKKKGKASETEHEDSASAAKKKGKASETEHEDSASAPKKKETEAEHEDSASAPKKKGEAAADSKDPVSAPKKKGKDSTQDKIDEKGVAINAPKKPKKKEVEI